VITSILSLVVVFLIVVAIAVPLAIRTNIDDRLLISWRGKGGLNRKKLCTLPHNPTSGSGFNIDCLIRVNVTSCVKGKLQTRLASCGTSLRNEIKTGN